MRFTSMKPCVEWHVDASLCTLGMKDEDLARRLWVLYDFAGKAKVNYTICVSIGGYQYREGTFVKELSLSFRMMDVPKEGVMLFARDLCHSLEQESVLVTCEPIEAYYLFNDSPRPNLCETVEDGVRERFGFDLNRRTVSGLRDAYETMGQMARIAAGMKGATMPAKESLTADLDCQPTECFTIYIGLDQRHGERDEELKLRAAQTIINTLRDNAMAYSLNVVYGGYEFEDGFFEQDSLQIMLIGAKEEDVRAVAQAICTDTGQEVALVTKSQMGAGYLYV